MKTAFEIIRFPVNTEKARTGWVDSPSGRRYTFLVDRSATKADVKKAVEAAFQVKVKDVRTMTRKGKFRRRRIVGGYTSDTKRAVVTLQPEQKIAFFEGI
jgi:large subunit ribosomal protein L23